MAIINYNYILAGKFATLTPSAKFLIPVLATLCDNVTGALPKKHSKASTLGRYAGLNEKYVRLGLDDLAAAGVIGLDKQRGRVPSIQYLPIVQLSTWSQGEKNGHNVRTSTPKNGHNVRTSTEAPPPETPATPAPSLPEETTANSLLLKKQLREETTTALPMPRSLIKQMIEKHGASVVVKVVSGMERKIEAGENIENSGAYFRECCANGWVPSSKAIQKKQAAAERLSRTRDLQEAKREQHEQLKKQIQAEQNDPEVQKNIALFQEEFWHTVQPQDSTLDSGHGQPKNSFRI